MITRGDGKPPTTNAVKATTQSKRKAAQDTLEKVETAAKIQGKRAKSNALSYLPKPNERGNYPNQNVPLYVRLSNLPQELLDKITDCMDPVTLTCLSLTCKEILSLVGRESWTECCAKRSVWNYENSGSWSIIFRQFLIPILGRDTPNLISCDICMTLHPPLRGPSQHRETKLTKRCFGPWSSIDYLSGYSLLWEHIVEARKFLAAKPQNKLGSRIKFLDGTFSVHYKGLKYSLTSSGRQLGRNLILKHEHIFRGLDPQSPLRLADIIALPARICPHQTTSTQPPEPNRYTKGKLPSGLLTHSIVTAAPPTLRVGIPSPNKFRTPSLSERKQMDAVATGVKIPLICQACPTKWQVQYSGQGCRELKITAWHSFGDTAYRAQEYWKMLVRREQSTLAREKRNSEFYHAATKHFLDFEINDEENVGVDKTPPF